MSAPLPVDLDRVDPEQAWQAWEPEPRDPWNSRWAGHLFRRAAFGRLVWFCHCSSFLQ